MEDFHNFPSFFLGWAEPGHRVRTLFPFRGGYAPKTHMEPENGPLKEAIPIGNPPFSGSMLIFGG